jgi:hypothetical protein
VPKELFKRKFIVVGQKWPSDFLLFKNRKRMLSTKYFVCAREKKGQIYREMKSIFVATVFIVGNKSHFWEKRGRLDERGLFSRMFHPPWSMRHVLLSFMLLSFVLLSIHARESTPKTLFKTSDEFDTIEPQNSSKFEEAKTGNKYEETRRFEASVERKWRARIRNLPHDSADLSPDLRIIIMTMDRRESFMRLWRSLEQAHYLGDRIDIDVWVDRNGTGQIVDAHFLQEISRLPWPQGKKRVHVWKRNAGIRRQWIDTWFFSAGSSVEKQLRERAVILEDDLSVSPLFYRWLKLAHEAYKDNDEVVAYTLTRASLCPAHCGELHGGPGPEDAATQFLSPLVGSWGFSPKVSHWIAFRKWYHEVALRNNARPYVEGLITTDWYRLFEMEHREQSMWTAFHIKYVHLHLGKMNVLYVKAPRSTTLASNHKEKGLHYAETSLKPDYPLMTKWHESMGVFPRHPLRIGWDGRALEALQNIS